MFLSNVSTNKCNLFDKENMKMVFFKLLTKAIKSQKSKDTRRNVA